MKIDYTGTILDDKFEVIRLLGEGGMGAVYLARHTTINKPVAVKFLHAALAGSEETVKRFYREAQAAAAVRHNSIIDVMDLGISPKGEPYIVMEYLDGEGLSDRISRKGPLSLAAACGIAEAALPALEAAHEKGIVHRDLKPDNIFLVYRKGELPGIKLIDFGISKFTSVPDQTKLTRDGSMLGTPAYMSPEQARGLDAVDQRTDLYAMGVIFYEMLTGEVPFTGSTYSELLLNMLTGEPRDPASLYSGFPEAARPVLARALEKDPAKRYGSAAEMLADIRLLTSQKERTAALGDLSRYLADRVAEKGGQEALESGDTQMSDTVLEEMIRKRGGSVDSKEPSAAASLAAAAKAGITRIVQRGETALAALEKRGTIRRLTQPIRHLVGRNVKRPFRLAGGIALLVLLPIVFGVALCGNDTVTISIQGAPNGARIFFNGEPREKNPFTAVYSEEPIPLRVETPRAGNFEISIVPSRDQTIEVRLGAVGTTKQESKNGEGESEKAAAKRQRTEKTAAQRRAARKASEKKVSESEPDSKADSDDESGESDKPKRRKSRFNWQFWKRNK